jgi:hypothetical protein
MKKTSLANFGYFLHMKVGKKKRILQYYWLPNGTYHQILAIGKKNSFEILQIWVIFSMQKNLFVD